MMGKPVVEKKVREERTGWRDLRFSQHHRSWGFDCPAQDVDFILIEYDHGKAVALIEYKNYKSTTSGTFLESTGHKALAELATSSKRPAFLVWYSDNFDWYIIHSLNKFAENQLLQSNYHPRFQYMDESEYVTFLYSIRGRSCPLDVKLRLQKCCRPPEEVNEVLQHISTNDAMKYLEAKGITVDINDNEIVMMPEDKVTKYDRALLHGKIDSVYLYLNPLF